MIQIKFSVERFARLCLGRSKQNIGMEQVDLRIICIGNLLHGNDGVGHAVFERLKQSALPPNVELLDGGIGGMTLLPHFKHVPYLLIIDLMKSDLKEGSVSLFENVIASLPVDVDPHGAHGGNLTTLLSMLPVYLDNVPEVGLLCVSAYDLCHFEPTLQSQVADAVEHVCTEVHHYIDDRLPLTHMRH